MAELVRIGKRYTIVIPVEARKKLGLKEGQLSEVRLEDGRLVITPRSADPFQELSALIGDVEYSKTVEKNTEKWLFSKASRRRHVSDASS
jgi:AbrB family looped-hinge helix DNA binding protein